MMFKPAPLPQCFRLVSILILLVAWGRTCFASESLKGAPYTRFYSFDEIGNFSAGADLTFDSRGRLIIVKGGAVSVLNDDRWLEVGQKSVVGAQIQHVCYDNDGNGYYGSVGSWGRLITAEQGLIQPQALNPAECPRWTLMTEFNRVVFDKNGVCFSGWNGVAYWNRNTGQTGFLSIEGVARTFTYGGEIYVSAFDRGVVRLETNTGLSVAPGLTLFGKHLIERFVELPNGGAVFSTAARELLIYEKGAMNPFCRPLWDGRKPRVTALTALREGGVAIAIAGQGIYIISGKGEIELSLTTNEYRRITSLVSNEPGVLWAATETGVIKVFYGAPVTTFGESLGLPVEWPQVVSWRNHVVIDSGGAVYQSVDTAPGEPSRFQMLPQGGWGMAVWKDWLLVGTGSGLFARHGDEPFKKVLGDIGISRLVMLESGVLLLIDTNRIGAVSLDGETWSECASRVPGLGFPAIVQGAKKSAWIEIGANLAGRITFENGVIKTQIFDSFPWKDPRWIHVSVVGDTVVLSGPEGGRVFYDENTGQLKDHDPLEAKLNLETRFWPARICEDDTGRLWMTHSQGVSFVRSDREGGGLDFSTYRIITDHIPTVHALPGGDIWLSSDNSLYHLRPPQTSDKSDPFRPILISVKDLRTGEELGPQRTLPMRWNLPYSENSIALRFFSGSYATRHALRYEARMNGGGWTPLDSSLLSLSNLREGEYRTEVQLLDAQGPIGRSMFLTFSIAPPWTRTLTAYVVYTIALVGLVFAVVQFFLNRAKAQSKALEKLVAQRTQQLQAAMKDLERETRTAATLAERNRLAGEIHDSLEQSFSALALQLETTAQFGGCPAEVSAGLKVARHMIAFSRDEVRHAVWDLHSPLLEAGGLKEALERLIAQLVPSSVHAVVVVQGRPHSLGSTVEHHLLRIAQEGIANAVKHAGAQRIEVRLTFADHAVSLTVFDDGKGFDPQTVLIGASGHFGLKSLRGRASKAGGELEIISQIGQGTRVTASIPKVKTTIV